MSSNNEPTEVSRCHSNPSLNKRKRYEGAPTLIGIVGDELVEVQISSDRMLEYILTPDNLNRAYKQEGSGVPSMICLAFNDIDMMLRDTGKFNAVECNGYGETRVADAMAQLKAESMMSESQNVMLCLYYNAESTSPLVMSELQSIVEVANELAENQFFWGVSVDSSITDDAVRISLITINWKAL